MSETYNADETGYNKKHFKLYEYWRDKYITKDGRVLDHAVLFADENFKEYLDQVTETVTSHGFVFQESTMIVAIADALEIAYRRGMLESAIKNE